MDRLPCECDRARTDTPTVQAALAALIGWGSGEKQVLQDRRGDCQPFVAFTILVIIESSGRLWGRLQWGFGREAAPARLGHLTSHQNRPLGQI
jgi:hypothetical protein